MPWPVLATKSGDAGGPRSESVVRNVVKKCEMPDRKASNSSAGRGRKDASWSSLDSFFLMCLEEVHKKHRKTLTWEDKKIKDEPLFWTLKHSRPDRAHRSTHIS